jgi:hypothetical protein
MERLTPPQRILATAIGLAITALVAALLIPWLRDQIESWLPPTPTALPPTPPPISRHVLPHTACLAPWAALTYPPRYQTALPSLYDESIL